MRPTREIVMLLSEEVAPLIDDDAGVIKNDSERLVQLHQDGISPNDHPAEIVLLVINEAQKV